MQSNDEAHQRIALKSYRYVCDWGSREQGYWLTIDVEKTVAREHFSLFKEWVNVPCQTQASISFSCIESAGSEVRSFVLRLRHSDSPVSVRIGIVSLDNKQLVEWETLQPRHQSYDYRSWFEWL